jgi:DNA processing protein
MLTNRERLILLNLIPEIGSTRLRRLLDAFGTLERVWAADATALQHVDGIGPMLAQRFVAARDNASPLRAEMARATELGVALITLEDAAYPAPLRTIHDPPLALSMRGALVAADAVAVGIVGARRASAYGMACAQRLAHDLASRGVTIVSGLARGIDAAAHRGALSAGGRTIAILGSGLGRLYPPEHASLAAQIAQHGALLSEYAIDAAPLPAHFPRRNRLISGLSLGIVVVEAAQRSGALITADCALEQGREVFAVPGPMTAVTSQGTHQLLKQGARLVTSVEDILEELRLAPTSPAAAQPAAQEQPPAPLPEPERCILACVSAREPQHIDAIASHSGLGMPIVSSVLLQLELKRLIQQLPGKQFVRCASS